MKNLKVSMKLLLGFGIVVVLALLIGVVGIFGLMSMGVLPNHARHRLGSYPFFR